MGIRNQELGIMINKILKIKNEKETIKAAANFVSKLKGGEVVALYGDLGAGKTVWVKGMAEGLGIKEIITSPTFVLMKCFAIKQRRIKNQESRIRNLCHVDAYRLKSSQELLSIGIEDYLGDKDAVTVIEWAERAHSLLRARKVIRIEFKFGEKEGERIIHIN